MRKILMIVTLSFIYFIGAASDSFAQLRNDIGSCKGSVVGILYTNNEIEVNDYATGTTRTFKITPDILGTLQEGSEVIIIFKKENSNVAKRVKVINKKEMVRPIPKTTTYVPATSTTTTNTGPATTGNTITATNNTVSIPKTTTTTGTSSTLKTSTGVGPTSNTKTSPTTTGTVSGTNAKMNY